MDELEADTFPSAEFEITRMADTKEIIDLKIIGAPFKPERVLPAFEMDVWRNGNMPNDGDILAQKINEIV